MYMQIKNMASIMLAITYCLYACLFLQAHLGSGQIIDRTYQTKDFQASADLFAKSTHSEQAFTNLSQELPATFDDTKRNHWISLESNGRFIERTFRHYQRFSAEFIISFWKSDLVFPFHQFW